MNKEIGVGRAHSKIILIGEHAVVYAVSTGIKSMIKDFLQGQG